MNDVIVMAYDTKKGLYAAVAAYPPLYNKKGVIDSRMPADVAEKLKCRHLDVRV